MFTESFFLSKLLLRGLLTFLCCFVTINKLFHLEIEIRTRTLVFFNKRLKSLDVSLRQYHWKIPILAEETETDENCNTTDYLSKFNTKNYGDRTKGTDEPAQN